MIEELILKELQEIKEQLAYLIKIHPEYKSEHQGMPESSIWNKKIAKEYRERREELDRITSIRKGQEIIKKWVEELGKLNAREDKKE
jgi:hypothetical protein